MSIYSLAQRISPLLLTAAVSEQNKPAIRRKRATMEVSSFIAFVLSRVFSWKPGCNFESFVAHLSNSAILPSSMWHTFLLLPLLGIDSTAHLWFLSSRDFLERLKRDGLIWDEHPALLDSWINLSAMSPYSAPIVSSFVPPWWQGMPYAARV
jgi:hypothetical protein